ncbi:MAG: threonine/serine exporter family protein, partial [Lachnospiraceae bacterium]|nr:threonine/serine exporter family protein [Lachnospiraceae bacterium]
MINNISRYLDLFVDIGKSMLESGAEIHRVEDSIYRLCDAYGMQQIEIFAIRSLIVVTVRDVTGQTYTDSKRIYELGIDMGQLEELNQLSRLICRDCPDDESIEGMIAECRKKKSVSKRETMIGYMLAASSFACFFGGRLRDGAAAAVLGLILFGFDEWVAVRRKQRFVYTVAVS